MTYQSVYVTKMRNLQRWFTELLTSEREQDIIQMNINAESAFLSNIKTSQRLRLNGDTKRYIPEQTDIEET